MEFLPLLTAFGAGSIVTSLVQFFLTSRVAAKRKKYDERKEAYIGLAEAWLRQGQEGITEKNKLDVGHWLMRCQFVAPAEMLPILKRWAESEPGSKDKAEATDHLKNEMRDDLIKFR